MKGKIVLGGLFIFFGVGMLLQQLGLWEFHNIISTWWPLILIFAGAMQLSAKSSSKTSGIILLLLGIYFQLKELDIIDVSLVKFFWPILIIAIGVSIIMPSGKARERFIGREVNQDVVDNVTVFSAVKSRNISRNFRGGSLVTVFGGIDMDLRNADLSPDGARIDATAAFGGIDILVPPDWKVVIKGIPLFGGWSNKTNMNEYNIEGQVKVLTVNCFCAFGGLEVKN